MRTIVKAFETDSDVKTFDVAIETSDVLNVDLTDNGFVIDLKPGNVSGWDTLWCSDSQGVISQ